MKAVRSDVRRIAVFRALVLGDLLCAGPALRTLKAAWPQADITLIGLPWAQALVGRLPGVDRVLPFPGHPALPEQPADEEALPAFYAQARAQRFDLLLQMHGSGGVTNPIALACAAGHTLGFHDPAQPAPPAPHSRFVPWPASGHEIERCLRLTDALGLPRRGLQLAWPVTPDDRAAAAGLWPDALQGRRYVCVHPGSQLPSRRWPVQRFAAVAAALADDGLALVLTGSAGEAALTAALQAEIQALRPGTPVLDLAGRTDLGSLAALVERAALVLCNDTGLSHLAAALRTPSVVVSLGGDVPRWRPLDARRHAVLWADLPCRPCAHAHCPHGHECALAIAPAQALAAARRLLREPQQSPHPPWPSNPASACASSPGMCTATTSTT